MMRNVLVTGGAGFIGSALVRGLFSLPGVQRVTALDLLTTGKRENLAEVADRIRAGELDARSNATSNDELGQLARTFDQMAQQLIETNQELQRRIGDAASDKTKSMENPPT